MLLDIGYTFYYILCKYIIVLNRVYIVTIINGFNYKSVIIMQIIVTYNNNHDNNIKVYNVVNWVKSQNDIFRNQRKIMKKQRCKRKVTDSVRHKI